MRGHLLETHEGTSALIYICEKLEILAIVKCFLCAKLKTYTMYLMLSLFDFMNVVNMTSFSNIL